MDTIFPEGCVSITCSIGYKGNEYGKQEFQMLRYPPGTTSWYPFEGSVNASIAVFGSRLWADDIAYVCRGGYSGGNILPGFMHTHDMGACNIPVGGKEIQIKNKADIEILVINKFGLQLGVTQPLRSVKDGKE